METNGTEPRASPEQEEDKAVIKAVRQITSKGGSAEVKRTSDGRLKVYSVSKRIVL